MMIDPAQVDLIGLDSAIPMESHPVEVQVQPPLMQSGNQPVLDEIRQANPVEVDQANQNQENTGQH